MSAAMIRRIEALEEARRGCLGRRVVTFDDWADSAAMEAHEASVRQLEAEGYEVMSIIRQHVPEGLHEQGGVRIERSYGAQS